MSGIGHASTAHSRPCRPPAGGHGHRGGCRAQPAGDGSERCRAPQSGRGDAGVDRRRQEGLRRQLRRLSRPEGPRRGEGRRRHLDHPGAGRQAAARPDRRPVGSRLDRRRDLHRHQEGRAADDDGRLGGPHLGHRDLEHRQLPARARRRSTESPSRRIAAAAARRRHGRRWSWRTTSQMPITGELGRRGHARPAGARQLPARRAGRPPLLRQRPQRPALHPRQADQAVHDLPRFQRPRRTGRACSTKLTFERNFATGLINVVFDPDYARNGVFYTIHMEDPTDRGAGRAEGRRRARPRPVRLPDDAARSSTPTLPGRADQPRSGDDRVDRPQHRERDVRRHGARAAADAAAVADSSARRDDLQSGRPAAAIPTGA